jgi:SH3-like domain-containing protein
MNFYPAPGLHKNRELNKESGGFSYDNNKKLSSYFLAMGLPDECTDYKRKWFHNANQAGGPKWISKKTLDDTSGSQP